MPAVIAPEGSHAHQAFITGPTGYSIVFSGTSAAALGDHQTLRVDLPATGWYEIDVSGAGWADELAERGPYRFAVEPLGAAPERVGGALVPGGHEVQAAAPPLEYVSSGHGAQDVAPASAATVPAGHGVHDVAPGLGAKVPGKHSRHGWLPLALADPGSHGADDVGVA